jgi:hypothetical protein
MSRFVKYVCTHAATGKHVDDYHTPNKIKLGSQILLSDRRHHHWPIKEFEIVAIDGKNLTVEEVE